MSSFATQPGSLRLGAKMRSETTVIISSGSGTAAQRLHGPERANYLLHGHFVGGRLGAIFAGVTVATLVPDFTLRGVFAKAWPST